MNSSSIDDQVIPERNIIIDNFYEDPYSIREFALKQNYEPHVYHPGVRTKSFDYQEVKNLIANVLPKKFGKIVKFNGNCFQYDVSGDITWIHSDKMVNWAGIVFLTPGAPPTSGTSFFKFYIIAL